MTEFSPEKLLFILMVAVLVIGPTRLPEYATKFANLVRELRRMASSAQEELREQLGPDFEEIDWRKLDPRQYDPRRIVRDALADVDPAPAPTAAAAPLPMDPSRDQQIATLRPGVPAPFA